MRKWLPVKIALACLLVGACVTINVYFPAAAAEQAADRVIDAVTKGGSTPAAPANPSFAPVTPPSSRAAPATQPLVLVAAGRVLELLIPAAQAQEPNIDVATPEVRAITASLADRFAQLKKYFDSGVVGLTADGLVDVRDANAAPLAERATVKRLVAEDNQDRTALYAAIAKGNNHPEWEPQIRKTFARRWVERGAQTGWYYQNSSGAWVQK